MIRTTIGAGVCGFHTTVAARSGDQQFVTLQIESDCRRVQELAGSLARPIDAYQEIGNGHGGVVLKAALVHLRAASTPNALGTASW
jgi:Family of unknown function (DUF6951)